MLPPGKAEAKSEDERAGCCAEKEDELPDRQGKAKKLQANGIHYRGFYAGKKQLSISAPPPHGARHNPESARWSFEV
jgi:hypothetical protein